jgi:phage repressor protein C with HTH and peptisase S24 domain
MPEMRERQQRSRIANFEIVRAGSGAGKTHVDKQNLVAIPLLKVVAAAHGESGGHPSSLLLGPAESMIAAPKDWCPNPGRTSCLRVRGNSMAPLIQDGYIVVVDSSQNDQIQLNGKIVIAWHKDTQR